MPETPIAPNPPTGLLGKLFGNSGMGVGVVLVFLPIAAIVVGVNWFNDAKIVGLPVLAILGIVILLGTLALVAMLFQHLGLTAPEQALALPPGSIRAAIALSLIVLFAIISITLYLSIAESGPTFKLGGLKEEERNAAVTAAGTRVVGVLDDECAVPAAAGTASAAPPPCARGDRRYTVVMRAAPPSEAIDLAKQLLVLVGTLMTSVTSFYFATRGTDERGRAGTVAGQPPAQTPTPGGVPPAPTPANVTPAAGGSTAAAAGSATASATVGPATNAAEAGGGHKHVHGSGDDADGCDVEIVEATPDEQLPAAEGGVATAVTEVTRLASAPEANAVPKATVVPPAPAGV